MKLPVSSKKNAFIYTPINFLSTSCIKKIPCQFFKDFVPAVPALDVTFILKTRSNLNIDVFDFLSILRNYVRARGFDGNTIDDKTISLEIMRP